MLPKNGGKRFSWRTLVIGAVVLPLFGLLFDAFNDFYVLRHSKSIYGAFAGLVLLAVLYLLGEAGATWVGSKDKVSHPLHKRVFHLFLMLAYTVLIVVAAWAAFKSLGILGT